MPNTNSDDSRNQWFEYWVWGFWSLSFWYGCIKCLIIGHCKLLKHHQITTPNLVWSLFYQNYNKLFFFICHIQGIACSEILIAVPDRINKYTGKKREGKLTVSNQCKYKLEYKDKLKRNQLTLNCLHKDSNYRLTMDLCNIQTVAKSISVLFAQYLYEGAASSSVFSGYAHDPLSTLMNRKILFLLCQNLVFL